MHQDSAIALGNSRIKPADPGAVKIKQIVADVLIYLSIRSIKTLKTEFLEGPLRFAWEYIFKQGVAILRRTPTMRIAA